MFDDDQMQQAKLRLRKNASTFKTFDAYINAHLNGAPFRTCSDEQLAELRQVYDRHRDG
jgi:hypothetical protein